MSDPTAKARALLVALDGVDEDAAFRVLTRGDGSLDWSALPTSLVLSDGARLRFDRRRRSATIAGPRGGSLVVDLGRPDRMRSVEAVLTPDLTRVDGPEVEISPPRPGLDWNEVALRDPFDPRGKRATMIAATGRHPVARYVDTEGVPRVLGFGDLDQLTGFGTFTMDGGSAYSHLRTSGLAGFHDARRASFATSVNDAHATVARRDGFAEVVVGGAVIGAVVDCGGPGDFLALAAYGGPRDGTVGIVVDLRRPPVRNGAIVDP